MTLQSLALDSNAAREPISYDTSDSEDDEYDEDESLKKTTESRTARRRSKGRKQPHSTLTMHEDADDEDVENATHQRHRPPRPSTAGVRLSRAFAAPSAHRRRRRSSARFLRLSHGRHHEEEDDEEATRAANDGNLGDIYKKAIRMNAENKINANNSWSLKLIENIDKFLEDDEDKEAPSTVEAEEPPTATTTTTFIETHDAAPPSSRVNFTKASCTLDASVKIYSYRVDDVHLTSYKVLANLNRSEQAPPSTSRPTTSEDTTETPEDESTPASATTTTTRTLESVAQLNVDSLDSAFDIDPLFHKLSKTFQEGGARGLLLVNLSTCQGQVVFDSSSAAIEPGRESAEEGLVDLGGFQPKLPEYLDTVEELPLVPQLTSLRAEYDALDREGFVDHGVVIPKTRRRFDYGAAESEELEADRSIHQDAMERSQRGQSIIFDEDDDVYAPDDMGGDDDHGWDDHEVGGLEPFSIGVDESTRYSSISFRESTEYASRGSNAATTAILNALTESDTPWAQSDMEYFSQQTMGNLWAGAAHWKRSVRRVGAPVEAKKAKTKTSTTPRRTLVELTTTPDMARIMAKPKKVSSLQWTKATVQKHGKNENVLPLDAGLGYEQLSKLFLRPNQTVGTKTITKTVGFAESNDEWAPDDFGGDDDDGPAFIPAGNDDDDDDDEVVLPELEGIRKVEKVQVGYATVAKKVDVKRLKKELWDQVEEQLETAPEVSFQEAVERMEDSKSQQDVTLPFYFISILHLANERGLGLESRGLNDFCIVPSTNE